MSLFRRRNKRSLLKKVRENLWPSMGWWRTVTYYRHRLFRTGDSTYEITAGLATGIAVSSTPFLGTHILQALFITYLLRGSLVSALAGTLWGNPWTFPFLFWLSYEVGAALLEFLGLGAVLSLPDHITLSESLADPAGFVQFLFSQPEKLLLPFTVGGYLCALLIWPVSYIILYYPVRMTRTVYNLRQNKIKNAKPATAKPDDEQDADRDKS